MKKAPICMCKNCGRSSNAKSKCAFEEKEKMAYCPTWIRIKEKKKV